MISITGEEYERMREDLALGMVSFGIPELFHIYEAIYYGDEEALAYHLKVAGIVHGTWYSGYQLARMWEFYRHGRAIMPFHTAMSGKGTLLGRSMRAASAPAFAAWITGGTIHALSTNDFSYHPASPLLDKAVHWWLGDLGRDDPRGGSEHGLFYNPQVFLYVSVYTVYTWRNYIGE